MPSRWIPTSCAKAFWPTIALLRWTFRPVTIETIRRIGQGRSVSMLLVRAGEVLAHCEGHDDLPGRRVDGAIAELVDRALDPPARNLPGSGSPGLGGATWPPRGARRPPGASCRPRSQQWPLGRRASRGAARGLRRGHADRGRGWQGRSHRRRGAHEPDGSPPRTMLSLSAFSSVAAPRSGPGRELVVDDRGLHPLTVTDNRTGSGATHSHRVRAAAARRRNPPYKVTATTDRSRRRTGRSSPRHGRTGSTWRTSRMPSGCAPRHPPPPPFDGQIAPDSARSGPPVPGS
jgi:hypothetical protein